MVEVRVKANERVLPSLTPAFEQAPGQTGRQLPGFSGYVTLTRISRLWLLDMP
jgi:hypothetical protein